MFNKIKESTVEKTQNLKNLTVFKWKKFIKKRAIKNIRKNLNYLQKKVKNLNCFYSGIAYFK